MRNVLTLIGAATVAFLAVGWYLGWYQVSRSPNAPGKQGGVQVEINSKKITDDVKKGVEQGTDLVDQIRDKSKGGESGKPAGPATNFFTPTVPENEKGSSSGWRPIGNNPPKRDGDPF